MAYSLRLHFMINSFVEHHEPELNQPATIISFASGLSPKSEYIHQSCYGNGITK